MKSILYTISIAFLVLALQSCSFNSIKGSGAIVENEINVSDYKGIDFSGGGSFVYEQKAGAPYLRIETDDNIYELLTVKVVDGILHIYSDENISPTKFNVITNSSTLEYLGASGSIKAHLKGKLETSKLDVAVSGSGNVTVDSLICETLQTRFSGSANFKAAGKVTNVESRISGSGKVLVSDLEADSVECRVSGSGDFHVYAKNHLKVNISGSGSVTYKGNPQIDQSISGSGKIKKEQ